MKKILAFFLCGLMLFSLAACGERNENTDEKSDSVSESSASPSDSSSEVTPESSNAVSGSNSESGSEKSVVRISAVPALSEMLDYIAPEFEKQTGYSIETDFVSVGLVIAGAKTGAADLILINSKDQEEKFIEDGFASTKRLAFVYNYFVICGPKDDPAGVAQTETAAEAFKAIAKSGSSFISIGDNSTSHIKETSIWESANIDPRSESWYSFANSNESDALKQANKSGTYVLADKTTYLSMKKSLRKLAILKDETADLKNTYSMIAVNAKAPVFADSKIKINHKGAKAFIKWIRSDEAVNLIEKFSKKTFGDNLFFVG